VCTPIIHTFIILEIFFVDIPTDPTLNPESIKNPRSRNQNNQLFEPK